MNRNIISGVKFERKWKEEYQNGNNIVIVVEFL